MKIKISLVILSILVLIQFIPLRKNESTQDENMIKIESQFTRVYNILENSCFDCHSNNTSYPWYNNIAPVSWYLAKHVRNGKKKLNFSEWSNYTSKEKSHLAEELIEVLEENEMPLKSYTLIHPEAKLTAEEKELIFKYFQTL